MEERILIPLGLALGVSAFATPAVARLARALQICDRPNERAVNRRAGMPLLGGLAVALGFACGLAAALWMLALGFPRQLGAVVSGGAVVLAAGIYDDRFGMNAWWKFAIQLAAAGIAVGYGFHISHISDPVSNTLIILPAWIAWPLTVIWIVGITNALNLIDGLDGLASGVGAIIAATLSVISYQAGQPVGFCIGIALVGALLGFLPFNFAPARIFLGDTGSMLIGYLLALLTLEGYRQISLLTFVVPMLALAVPILDTALSVIRRLRMRTPIFSADRLHMHHRLLAVEGSQRGAVLQFYVLTAAFCLIALSFTRLKGVTAFLFLAVVGLLTVRLLWNLGFLFPERDASAAGQASAGGDQRKS